MQLQHWFASKDELLVFALGRLGMLTGARVEQALLDVHTPEHAAEVMERHLDRLFTP